MTKNRFAVVPVERRTMDGIIFASKKEMLRYYDLKMLKMANEISDLELQPKFPVFISSKTGMVPFCTYTADFRYKLKDGTVVVEELKSTGTAKDAAYRLRRKAAEIFHGMKVNVIIK